MEIPKPELKRDTNEILPNREKVEGVSIVTGEMNTADYFCRFFETEIKAFQERREKMNAPVGISCESSEMKGCNGCSGIGEYIPSAGINFVEPPQPVSIYKAEPKVDYFDDYTLVQDPAGNLLLVKK